MNAKLEIVKLTNDVVTESGCADPDTPQMFEGDGPNCTGTDIG